VIRKGIQPKKKDAVAFGKGDAACKYGYDYADMDMGYKYNSML